MKWISVKQELPPVGEEVLTFATRYGCVVNTRDSPKWWRSYGLSVTHWMPLPDAPPEIPEEA